MSAIAGVCNFQGQPIEPEFLSALGNKLNARGPDGGAEVIRDSIGMGYRAFHTNKESHLEHQPLIRNDNYMLTWDGRLDNRDELISQLSNELCDDQTDVTIVMAAYVRWGNNFLSRLLGDFTLALWNARTRTLVLARDPIGPRTLYYHKNGTRIVWATELAALLDLAEVDLEVNDEYLAEFLTRLAEPSLTPYKQLYPVPPGHAVVITDGQFRVQRFWSLDPHKVIRYKQDSEYEEHFRALFLEAVACRLRVDGTVWAELSGGMDSSAIVCMADEIIKSEHVQASSLQTVSLVFDEASKSDERKYIRYVERKIGRAGLHLREDEFRMLSRTGDGYSEVIPNPSAVSAEYYTALYGEMSKRNGRVLLAGKGGDELLTAFKDPAPELADLFVCGRLIQLHRRLRFWSKVLQTAYFDLLWEKTVLPVLPRKLRVFCERRPGLKTLKFYDCRFVKRMHMRQRALGQRDSFGFCYPSGRMQSEWFLQVVRELSAGLWRQMGNLEITYPLTHRPLVEFLQAIPFDQRVRPGQTRSLLRRSLRGLLPLEIINRKGKTLNTDAVMRAFSREQARLYCLLKDGRAIARGYLNGPAVLAALSFSRAPDPHALSLTYAVALELWLRAFESRKQSRAMKETMSQKVESSRLMQTVTIN